MSISVKRSNFTLVYFKAACHANYGAEINFAGSDFYISRQIFQKFSNTSANNNIDILLIFSFQNIYKLLRAHNLH